MTTKNAKTIFFASLIATMFMSFGSVQLADAEKQYSRSSIDTAFTNAEEYVIYDKQTGHIGFDTKSMKKDGVSKKDIRIVEDFADINNELMDMAFDEQSTKQDVREYYSTLKNGQFKQLFDPSTAQLRSYTGSFWSLTACGITFGVTAHPHTNALYGIDGYSSLSSIQDALEDDGYYQVPWPAADWSNVGRDYAKINTTGVGGCDDGEFRDQNFIYSPESTHGNLAGWHTLQHINEPNSDLPTYDAPTFWWNTYVIGWHYDVY